MLRRIIEEQFQIFLDRHDILEYLQKRIGGCYVKYKMLE